MKLKKRVKTYNIIIILILIVLFISFITIHYINKNISPKITVNLKKNINKINNDIIMDSFNYNIINDYNINEIIKLTKNKNDEIIAIDFDMKSAYNVSLKVTSNIKESLHNINKKEFQTNEKIITSDKDGYILLVPIGLYTNNIFINNLGPKIPVKVSYLNNLVTGLSTKVKAYGINNVLIEIYININLKEEILVPYIKENINNSFKILIASKIIDGKVPDIYNGLIEKNSSLINTPLY